MNHNQYMIKYDSILMNQYDSMWYILWLNMIQYDLELYVNIFGMGFMSMFMSDMRDALKIYFIDDEAWDLGSIFRETQRMDPTCSRHRRLAGDFLDELSNFRSSQWPVPMWYWPNPYLLIGISLNTWENNGSQKLCSEGRRGTQQLCNSPGHPTLWDLGT